ncbi:MAG: protein TolR [Gammaproteobacteria bacterium]|nr:protein TolR [Gammaproteobacteria bacterium]
MARRQRRTMMGEINVVPYIDVMLVLLVIFMVTAPMLTQGVKVDLPQAAAKPVDQEKQEPIIISVDAQGDYYLNIEDQGRSAVNAEMLVIRIAAEHRLTPNRPVYVRGDAAVNYGAVITAMTLIQQAGVASVGLLTQPPEPRKK